MRKKGSAGKAGASSAFPECYIDVAESCEGAETSLSISSAETSQHQTRPGGPGTCARAGRPALSATLPQVLPRPPAYAQAMIPILTSSSAPGHQCAARRPAWLAASSGTRPAWPSSSAAPTPTRPPRLRRQLGASHGCRPPIGFLGRPAAARTSSTQQYHRLPHALFHERWAGEGSRGQLCSLGLRSASPSSEWRSPACR
ncbi:hypothetical protein C2E23DRAFT_26243 [Lenzites betulinus]|nr:hypothetical protein C2E23DRAFT_26243 [Lenzites betulinus]